MSLWADAKIREHEAEINKLKEQLADLLSLQLRPFGNGATEPPDKRTKEWKDWHEKHG